MTLVTGKTYNVTGRENFVGLYLGTIELAGGLLGHEFEVDGDHPDSTMKLGRWYPILLDSDIINAEVLARW